VTGDIKLTGADVAEQFDVATDVPAGSVVCLDDSAPIDVCRKAYDKRVAGIVSGLGDRQPAVILDRTDRGLRRPVAVVGKAWCLANGQASGLANDNPWPIPSNRTLSLQRFASAQGIQASNGIRSSMSAGGFTNLRGLAQLGPVGGTHVSQDWRPARGGQGGAVKR
jgi:hypothetical protein